MDTIEVPISMELRIEGEKVFGHARLEGRREVVERSAEAARHIDGTIDSWALDLVKARLLRALEIELMETVHERIDRSVVNDV